ncbi:MAG TPA: tRNA (adenosine(37)-N6)-threonylcarbamoyltransferase complex transferase subunit TsaD, partial [Candidatus Margulisiibacteriota bacterium]|nr:tRNA (adenosine(37)-N6)-threonylcarbamoyltransferase complex transferase subunit TsaD [Candidatus Margulisiibacteriota bacterium]
MNVLGIETSCDETSVAVVRRGRDLLSNVVISSLRFHKKYGGIIPEIASRMQLETIALVAEQALKDAGLKYDDIGLISVTSGPGLLGSLLVGISFAKALALSLSIPLIGVNHVHSHIYANFLDRENVKLPYVALVVSGGHTSLFYVKDFDKITLLGQTQDDACGEAFDKVAKILGLGYPGGPFIEEAAKRGEAQRIKFNCSGTKNPLDFSFSGIKTAVLYYVKDNPARARKDLPDIAASFQEAVINTLIKKSLMACELKNSRELVIGGGVVANNALREKFARSLKKCGVRCFFPQKSLCMDNA